MKTFTTTDLSKFGSRERKIAEQILHAWNEDELPEDFLDDEVTIMMNIHSGNVFLTNSEFQVAMMNNGSLQSFYTDFESGEEGFIEDLSIKAIKNLGLAEPEEILVLAPSIIDGVEFDCTDRKTIELLLLAWNEDQLPENFARENIRIAKNKFNSIYLTNAQNQIAKLDGYDVKLCHINQRNGGLFFVED